MPLTPANSFKKGYLGTATLEGVSFKVTACKASESGETEDVDRNGSKYKESADGKVRLTIAISAVYDDDNDPPTLEVMDHTYGVIVAGKTYTCNDFIVTKWDSDMNPKGASNFEIELISNGTYSVA